MIGAVSDPVRARLHAARRARGRRGRALPEREPSAPLDHREHSFEGRLAEIAAAGEGAVLCGYSLGGRLALHAALRDPGPLRGVVTVGARAGHRGAGGAQRPGRGRRAARRLDGDAPIEEIVGVWERQPLFADQSRRAGGGAARRAGSSQDPRSLALLLRTAGQGALEPVWHELDELRAAAAGARRRPRRALRARRASGWPRPAPDGRAALVEQAGHAAQLQRPEAVAGAR